MNGIFYVYKGKTKSQLVPYTIASLLPIGRREYFSGSFEECFKFIQGELEKRNKALVDKRQMKLAL